LLGKWQILFSSFSQYFFKNATLSTDPIHLSRQSGSKQ
jgi:hypothetical protein